MKDGTLKELEVCLFVILKLHHGDEIYAYELTWDWWTLKLCSHLFALSYQDTLPKETVWSEAFKERAVDSESGWTFCM